MAMESLDALNGKVQLLPVDSMQRSDVANEIEQSGVAIADDIDSYLEDIYDRLTISRMVSDSVVKGMVTAVVQEAEEKIAQKELEVVELKVILNSHCVGVDKEEAVASLESVKGFKSFMEAVAEHDRMKRTLGDLRRTSREQVSKLKNQIDLIRECSSVTRKSLGSESLLDGLETTIDTVFKGMEEIVDFSGASLSEWKQEQEFRAEVEASVMGRCIHSLEQEFERKIWDRICGEETLGRSGRTKEISSLREELNSISKSLCTPEAGQLISHGSLDSEGWTNGKRSHFSRNVVANHVENGNHEESQRNKLENHDPNYLGHLNREELIVYYNNEISKLRRNHESKVQEMTEEYFSLKREYLKDRGSLLHLKKDKELITLRNRIPEVISKLDDILVETEKIGLSNGIESLGSLKDRLETLLAENHRLRDFLSEKKKEVRCLATQVSDATERTSQHSLSETKLLNTNRYLKSSIEDLHIQAAIKADVFACLLTEMSSQINRSFEDSCKEYHDMQQYYESVIKDANCNTQPASKCGVEDSDLFSISMQELLEVIYREAWREARDKHDMLTMKYIDDREVRDSLEKKALEREKTIKVELADKERLKQEIRILTEEKERLAQESAATLLSKNKQLELASIELENLRIQHQTLISESSKESDNLVSALEEVELHKLDVCKLNEKLVLAAEEFRKVVEERRTLLGVIQEKQRAISSHEANEREFKRQMGSMVVSVQGLSKGMADFESRVTKDILKNQSRLKNLGSQSGLLIQKANILRRTGLLYKQRLERKSTDFQKAEAEVDLLGDEVDNLLSLLEKIYLALDHYSPVLKHYPGIMETLRLVKRELSGVSPGTA